MFSTIHVAWYLQILVFYAINYFHTFNLNIRHLTHEAREAATWTRSGSGFSPDPGQLCDNHWRECLVLYMLHDISKFHSFMSLTTSTNSNWTFDIFLWAPISNTLYETNMSANLLYSVTCITRTGLCNIPKERFSRALQHWCNIYI